MTGTKFETCWVREEYKARKQEKDVWVIRKGKVRENSRKQYIELNFVLSTDNNRELNNINK